MVTTDIVTMKNKTIESKNSRGFEPLLKRLYAERRSNMPPMGVRTIPAVLCATILAMALSSIILSLSWVQNSEIAYLRNSAGVTILQDLQWQVKAADLSTTGNLDTLADFDFKVGTLPEITLDCELPSDIIKSLAQSLKSESIVFSMPELVFEHAIISTNWSGERTIARGERATLAFNAEQAAKHEGPFHVRVIIKPIAEQTRLLKNSSSSSITPAFVAGMNRYQTFQDFAASQRVGSGKQLADIGRIVLALFTILLFIFIDSSPECFGLGIFMSLKALGVVASQRWYPDTMVPVWLTAALPGFLLSFADFMQLYFFTQLARLAKPRQFLWLGVGLIFGAIYAWGISQPTLPNGINWSREVWRYRNIGIGLACLACALPVSVICFKDRHYHRVAALLVASSGVLVQILTPLFVDMPQIADAAWFKTWYNLFETHTPYVFALSTFINVSTLEQRVKTLTTAAVQSELIQGELRLGKTMQQSFLQIPELPKGVSMAYAHEAAAFVSGDIIFSHFDPNKKRITTVMCDVTGHGVQAALKASICSAVGDFIWNDARTRVSDSASDRMGIFFQRVTGMLSKLSRETELLAMVGCEVALDTRDVTFYRANAVFPIIVTENKAEPGSWTVECLSFPEASHQTMQIKDPFYVLLFSDGLLDGSRSTKSFVHWVSKRLMGQTHLDATELKNLVMEFKQWPETGDDRTMVVMEVA